MIVILVGNQKDREEFREVSVRKAQEFRKKHNIPYFVETSAKTGENVEQAFMTAARELFKQHWTTIREQQLKQDQSKTGTKKLRAPRNANQ